VSYTDYDAMLAEKAGGRPEFTVAGQRFTARSKLSWKKFNSWVLSMEGVDATSQEAVDRTVDFFRMALLPESRERFIALLDFEGDDDDPDADMRVISNEAMTAILDDLLARYTGKAKKNETESSSGPGTTGPSSNVVSLNPRVS
jgi:hypothetical protein